MLTLEELAQLDKTGLKKMASVTNGNETHLSLIEKVQSQEKLNSFHLGKKKPAVANPLPNQRNGKGLSHHRHLNWKKANGRRTIVKTVK